MRITVSGRPITQGSLVRTRYSVRDANSALKPWRDNVRSAAVDAVGTNQGFGRDPVIVTIIFTFARPRSHSGTGKNARNVKINAPRFPSSHNAGDVDKLARACLDALTDAGCWDDDSQVVQLHARKCWVGTLGALDRPGAVIDVTGAARPDQVQHVAASHSSEILDSDVQEATP